MEPKDERMGHMRQGGRQSRCGGTVQGSEGYLSRTAKLAGLLIGIAATLLNRGSFDKVTSLLSGGGLQVEEDIYRRGSSEDSAGGRRHRSRVGLDHLSGTKPTGRTFASAEDRSGYTKRHTGKQRNVVDALLTESKVTNQFTKMFQQGPSSFTDILYVDPAEGMAGKARATALARDYGLKAIHGASRSCVRLGPQVDRGSSEMEGND